MTTRRTARTEKKGAKGYEVRLSTEKEDPAVDGELHAHLCVGPGGGAMGLAGKWERGEQAPGAAITPGQGVCRP